MVDDVPNLHDKISFLKTDGRSDEQYRPIPHVYGTNGSGATAIERNREPFSTLPVLKVHCSSILRLSHVSRIFFSLVFFGKRKY